MSVKIRNTGNRERAVIFEGRQIVLRPYEEANFEEKIAKQFVREHSPEVEEVDLASEGSVVNTAQKKERMYIANMTGNPDAPETINTKVWQNRNWTVAQVENPFKQPVTLRETAQGSQVQSTDKWGYLQSKKMASTTISIPPYRRAVMEVALGEWFLGRCATSTPQSGDSRVIKAMECRPPADFEARPDWDLDDLRLFLKMTDPTADAGPSEEQLLACLEDESMANDVIRDAKLGVWRRLFFRIVDSRYRLPTEREFVQAKARTLAKQMAEESAPQKEAPKRTAKKVEKAEPELRLEASEPLDLGAFDEA